MSLMRNKKPEVIWELADNTRRALVECPGCGERMFVDNDQYHGKVSMDCPECEYHETHDLSRE